MRTVGSILLLAVAGLIIWRVREVIVTVLLALVMAYLLRPMVNQFCALHWRWRGRRVSLPRGAATTLVFLFLGLVGWAVWVVSAESVHTQVKTLQANWPDYQQAIETQVENAQAFKRDLPDPLRKSIDAWMTNLPASLSTAVQQGSKAALANVKMIIELILVPILAFYILSDGRTIRQQVLFFIPSRYLEWTAHALDRADDAFARFIRGQLLLCLIAFVVVTIGLRALGVDFYLLLGVIAGVTRAIPVIGPLVGALPILIVLLLTQPPVVSLWAMIVFTLLHLLESKLLMPAVLGRELNLHPVLIIVALLIGAQVSGLLGMFIAAPVLAVIRTLLAEQRQHARELPEAEIEPEPV